MSDTQRFTDALARTRRKVTRGRLQVYRVLAAADRPLSNVQLIERLPEIDRVSVYRTLELFESIGITHRVWNGFKSAVELSGAFSPHHHHFTCTRCGQVSSIKSDAIERAIAYTAAQLDATITSHVIELQGLCRRCARTAQ